MTRRRNPSYSFCSVDVLLGWLEGGGVKSGLGNRSPKRTDASRGAVRRGAWRWADDVQSSLASIRRTWLALFFACYTFQRWSFLLSECTNKGLNLSPPLKNSVRMNYHVAGCIPSNTARASNIARGTSGAPLLSTVLSFFFFFALVSSHFTNCNYASLPHIEVICNAYSYC